MTILLLVTVTLNAQELFNITNLSFDNDPWKDATGAVQVTDELINVNIIDIKFEKKLNGKHQKLVTAKMIIGWENPVF